MTAHRPTGEVAEELWQRLLAEPWPLPREALPPGTALVGGAVRDGLLGSLERQPDLDVVVPGDALALTRQLAREHGGTCVVLDAERSIARLVLGDGASTWPARKVQAWKRTWGAGTTQSMPSPCPCPPPAPPRQPWWTPPAVSATWAAASWWR